MGKAAPTGREIKRKNFLMIEKHYDKADGVTIRDSNTRKAATARIKPVTAQNVLRRVFIRVKQNLSLQACMSLKLALPI